MQGWRYQGSACVLEVHVKQGVVPVKYDLEPLE